MFGLGLLSMMVVIPRGHADWSWRVSEFGETQDARP